MKADRHREPDSATSSRRPASGPTRRRRSRLRSLLFVGLAAGLALVVLEVILQGVCLVSPRVDWLLSPPRAAVIADPVLGHRPDPAHPDHDDAGFRNATRPARVTVVAMGDSQTYGAGVERDEAWPQQLAALGGVDTYNLAFGGWGPPHALLLLDEALALEPRVIVEAFYTGNDLFDSFRLVQVDGRLPELAETDADTLAAIEAAEGGTGLVEGVDGQFHATGYQTVSALRMVLSRRSRLYGLLRHVKNRMAAGRELPWSTIRAAADANPEVATAFEHGEFRTIFTPKYRLAALDQGDARLRTGHRIALDAITEMHRRARERGVTLIVLVIPTKMTTFGRELAVQGRDGPPAALAPLLEHERVVLDRTRDVLSSRGIETIGALDALRGCLDRGIQPYDMTTNDHLNAAGHRAVAELVLTRLRRRGLLDDPGAGDPRAGDPGAGDPGAGDPATPP